MTISTSLLMSPSLCPVEHRFSVLHAIHTKARTQLGQDIIEDLLFIVINCNVINNVQLDDDFVSSIFLEQWLALASVIVSR